MPRTTLVIGPTTAVRNSARALGGSRSRLDTPPKRKSVMRSTGTPKRLATREWASSWRTTETKKRIVAATAVASAVAVVQSGCQRAKAVVRLQLIKSAMRTQDVSIAISIPKMRPSRSARPPFMSALRGEPRARPNRVSRPPARAINYHARPWRWVASFWGASCRLMPADASSDAR